MITWVQHPCKGNRFGCTPRIVKSSCDILSKALDESPAPVITASEIIVRLALLSLFPLSQTRSTRSPPGVSISTFATVIINYFATLRLTSSPAWSTFPPINFRAQKSDLSSWDLWAQLIFIDSLQPRPEPGHTVLNDTRVVLFYIANHRDSW